MKRIFMILLLCSISINVYALNLSRVKTWGAEVLTYADLNAEFDNILDHSITNSDISASAAIVGSKLDLSVPGAIGGTTPAAGSFTTLSASSTLTVSGASTFGDDIASDTDDTDDLGTSSIEWKDLYVDGTGNIDSLVADTADINAGTVDATIGGTTPAAGTFTNVTLTGVLELAAGAVGAPSVNFGDSNTGFYAAATDQIDLSTGGSIRYTWGNAATIIYTDFWPNGGGNYDSGSATNYWDDVSYKTLTDRGCLGWFDDGVEMQDGSIVTDVEALRRIKKHPTKKTIYGIPMLDYKTFPKGCYKPADKDGELLLRDENDDPYWIDEEGKKRLAADGVETTYLISLLIGAIKENAKEIDRLNKRINQLEDKIKT